MKQVDIIRLGLIGIALIFAYRGINGLIEFLNFLFTFWASEYKPEGRGAVYFIVQLIFLFGTAFLLIKNSRRIAGFIDEQK
jgi:hypothetical protein